MSDKIFEGEVEGTNKIPYHVTINTEHPKSSTCNCPYATGRTTCKHMVALFFAVSPEDRREYEEWANNDYKEEYEDDEYDYYDDDYYDNYRYNQYDSRDYRDESAKPVFFDELLSNFINNLSDKELREILTKELKKNEKSTYDNYLKEQFEKQNQDEIKNFQVMNKISSKFHDLSHNYDYNYKDYSQKLLTTNEKKIITNIYSKTEKIKGSIDKILLNPELATYNDYKWIAAFYKERNNEVNIKKYTEKLESFFDTLKHYSIKNTIPKSNILITLQILNNYSQDEIAESLIKYCKYPEYITYVLSSSKSIKKLYKLFDEKVENAKYVNREHISDVYYAFHFRCSDEKIFYQCSYYSFLYDKDDSHLRYLDFEEQLDYYVDKILKSTKDVITLEKVFIYLDKKEDLFKLLFKRENEHRLIANIERLADEYGEKMKEYFKKRFYEVIAEDKSRANYQKAMCFIIALSRLNDGKKIVDNLIVELKNSEYANRRALFDEINKITNVKKSQV